MTAASTRELNTSQNVFCNFSAECFQDGLNAEEWKCYHPDCGKIFRFKKSMINHFRQTHTQDDYLSCRECHKQYSSIGNLNVHMRIHDGQKPLKCDINGCNKRYRTPHFLSQHKQKEHFLPGDENENCLNKCTYCGRLVSTRNLKAHNEKHLVQNRIICLVCNKLFYNSVDCERHMTRQHTGDRGKIVEHQLDANKCLYCPKRFLTAREVRDHCLMWHKDFEGIPCKVCGKPYKNVALLTIHTKTHFEEEDINSRKFQCPECTSKFKTKSHLNEHVEAIHSKCYRFTCPVCNHGFIREAKLQIHLERFHRPMIDTRSERSRQRDKLKHKKLLIKEKS